MGTETNAWLALATAAGAQALPGFAVALAVLLIVTASLWWSLRRYAVPRESSRLPPAAFLAMHAALGFALILGAGALFAEIAEALGAQQPLGRADQAFSDAVRTHLPAAALHAFAAVTRLGNTETLTGLCIVVAVALGFAGRRWLALSWVVAVAGNAVLNVGLKAVFERARPFHEHGPVQADGWSFPSGHASGSVVAYGMLAYVLLHLLPARWHLPVVLAAAGVAFTIGCSRVFLQVHYASDVLAGFASGTAWLAVCIASVELTRYYRRHRQGPS